MGNVKQTEMWVEFFSPGTFVSETTRQAVDDWDIDKAAEMAKDVVERHGATPYGFRFGAKADGSWDRGGATHRSPMFFLGGVVRTVEQVEADNRQDEQILLGNMRTNGWDRVVTIVTAAGYTHTAVFEDGDEVVR